MTKTYSISIAVDGLYATRGKFQYSEGEGIRSGFIEDCDAPWDDSIYTAIEDELTESEPADGQIEIEGKTYSWVLTPEHASKAELLSLEPTHRIEVCVNDEWRNLEGSVEEHYCPDFFYRAIPLVPEEEA